jgi:hypothetical protein
VSAPERDPLVDPVRGDIIEHKHGDAHFVTVVLFVERGRVGYLVGRIDEIGGQSGQWTQPLNEWSKWRKQGLRDITIVRRGDA